MSEHTPGPWRVTDENKARRVIRGGTPERSIVIVEDWTTEADANLLAAAPELLAAVKRAYEIETSVTQGQERDLRQGYNAMLRAAIAKAEATND